MKTFINMNFMVRGILKANGYISESVSCSVMSDSLLPHETTRLLCPWNSLGKQWQTLFWGAPKSLQMVTAAMKLKDAYFLEGKL